ncbi:MAG: thiamine phosphate synthase [Gemmatimonadota bacterium]
MSVAAHVDPASLRLIAITDSLRDGIDGLASRAARAVLGGATMIQVRLEHESPRTLVESARAIVHAVAPAPVLVSARADVALAAGAHGVYSSVDDLSPAILRRFVPEGFIIGVSLGSEADLTRVTGADFVGIGPLFSSGASGAAVGLGLDRFAALARRAALPAVAIGGIAADNVRDVMRAGASGVAAISAVFASSDAMVAAAALCAAMKDARA